MAEQPTNPETWERSPGFVYFMAAGDEAQPIAVKIGVTKKDRLKNRVSEHQGSNHETLRLLGVIPFQDSEKPMKDAEDYEEDFIQKFKRFQLREGRGREWFEATPELLDCIYKIISPVNESTSYEFQSKTARNDSGKQYMEIDEFWSKFQTNKNINEYEINAVKSFHDTLALPGYVPVLRGSLQFRLYDKPDEIVMAIRTDGRMEIYLDHSQKTLIKNLILKHVKSEKIQLSLSKNTYPLIDSYDWKEHINEFRDAFDQIAEESDPLAYLQKKSKSN